MTLVTANTVEAAIIYHEGRMILSPAKQDAMASVDIAADVIPDPDNPSSIYLLVVYSVNPWTGHIDVLTGQDRKTAEAILLGDDEWLEWAYAQIASPDIGWREQGEAGRRL